MNIYQKKKEHYSLIYLLDKLDNSFRFFSENYSGQNIAFEVIWIHTDNSSSSGEIDISSFKNISRFLFANIYDGAETPQEQYSKYINIHKITNTKLYWKSDTSLLGSFRVLAIGIGN